MGLSARELILKVTEMEGKKEQISVAQVSEVIGCVADLVYESHDTTAAIGLLLYRLGYDRDQRRNSKKSLAAADSGFVATEGPNEEIGKFGYIGQDEDQSTR